MPLPTPRGSETEAEFVTRCVGEIQSEFEDTAQRVAVCHRQWDDGKHWRVMALPELEAWWRLSAKAVREGTPPTGRASTLRIVQPMLGLLLKYQGALLRPWDRMWVGLEAIAHDETANTAVGYAIADPQIRGLIEPTVLAWLDAAGEFYPRAWDVGAAAAARWTSGPPTSQIPPETRLTRLRQLQLQNAEYVRKLFAAVYDGLREILVDPSLPAKSVGMRLREAVGWKAPPRPTRAGEAAQALERKQSARVTGYVNPLWGVAHEAFADEIEQESLFVTNWVTTSEDPCDDCLKLEDGSPYGPGNPLPTVPGAGATVCRTNCMCILEASGTDPILEGRRKDPSKPNQTLYRGGPVAEPEEEEERAPAPRPAPEPEPVAAAPESGEPKPRDWNALPRSYGLGKEGREEFRKVFDKATTLAPELARTVSEIVQQPLGKTKLAQYNPNNGVLTLNDRVFKKGEYTPQPGEENWFAVPTTEGISMHELGHAVEKLIQQKGIRTGPIPALSDYAKTSQPEAFAEAFAALALGKHGKSEAVKVVKDALAAYRKALKK